MAQAVKYVAMGEEDLRGTAEDTAVFFVPVMTGAKPVSEFQDDPTKDFRGAENRLGDQTITRKFESWNTPPDIPLYSELAGPDGPAGIAKILKHGLGKATTGAAKEISAYPHMIYPHIDPFDTGSIGSKALTYNDNMSEGATVINTPYVGGRVKALNFEQELPEQLKLSLEMFGQYKDVQGAEIGDEAYPLETLRFDYDDLEFYQGVPAYTGDAPDYTEIDPSGGNLIKVDKLSIKITNGFEDVKRSSGLKYAEHTRVNGPFKVELEFTMDYEDPASGFSSVDDFNAWLTAASETAFTALWDTGTVVAGGATTETHKLIIDMPRMQRMGGEIEFDLEKDPLITLKYEGLFDPTTTQYLVGILLQNSAETI